MSPIFIESFFIGMVKQHKMSDRCANNIHGYFNQVFEYARRMGYIKSNPMLDIDKNQLLCHCTIPPVKTASERIYSKEAFCSLFKAIQDDEKAHPEYIPNYAIELAMYTGMRVGELAALKWTDIDCCFIHIDHSEHRLDYKEKTCELVIGEPKTRKHRLFPITPEIQTLLDKIKTNTGKAEGFVFTNSTGERYTARAIGCAATRRSERVGIEKGSIHRIRRTVSSLLNQSMPQKEVAALLGHTEEVNETAYNYSMATVEEQLNSLSIITSTLSNSKIS